MVWALQDNPLLRISVRKSIVATHLVLHRHISIQSIYTKFLRLMYEKLDNFDNTNATYLAKTKKICLSAKGM